MERAARERAEMAAEAARLEALRQPKSAEGGFPSFLRSPASCESNYDCEQPQVCCDLLVARICCSSGLRVGAPQPKLQGSLIPIPVEKDEPFPASRGMPPAGSPPW